MNNAKLAHTGEELLIVGEEATEEQAQAISTIAHEIGANGILEVLEILLTVTAGSLRPSDEQTAMSTIAVHVGNARNEIRWIVGGAAEASGRPYGYSLKGFEPGID